MDRRHMEERVGEIEKLLSLFEQSDPDEVKAFMNFMDKAEAGPALLRKEKDW